MPIIRECDDYINLLDARKRFENLKALLRFQTEDQEEEYLFLQHILERVPPGVQMLINDDVFEDYVRDLANLPEDTWLVIDWERTAANVQQDYKFLLWSDCRYWWRT